MTYPWSSGEVLTAADLNAYAGLILVKTQTIGTAVSSVTVSDAFSSTFDNYLVAVDGVTSSTNTGATMYLSGATSGYSYTLIYTKYIAGAGYTILEESATSNLFQFCGQWTL
jgi:hypothetical protein